MEAAARKTWKRKTTAVVQMSFKTSGRGGRRCQRNFNIKLSWVQYSYLLGRRLKNICSTQLRGLHKRLVGWFLKHPCLHSSYATSAPGSVVRPRRGGVGPGKQTTEVGVGRVGNTRREGQNQHNISERLQHPWRENKHEGRVCLLTYYQQIKADIL